MRPATRSCPDGLRRYAVDAPVDLVDMLHQTVSRTPKKVAFVDVARSVTYEQFLGETEWVAARLHAHGLRPGERMGLLALNGLAFTTALWAAWRLQAIVVPANHRLHSREILALMKDADPRLVLVGESFAEVGDEIRRSPNGVLVLEERDRSFLGEGTYAGGPLSSPGSEAPAAIMYTSGTTGSPKGVVISHGNAIQNSLTCLRAIGRHGDDTELITVPQFNVTGLNSQTIPVVHGGMTAVLAEAFVPAELLQLMERHEVSVMVGAPTMWWRILEDDAFGRHDTGAMRLVLYGGAPMPTTLLERMREAFPGATMGNGYGMTETCSMVAFIGGSDATERPNSVGQPLPISDIRLVDPVTLQPVPVGHPGELWVRGPQVTPGYWRREEDNRALFHDGWLRTGDSVEQDEDDFLYLRDRLKDVIKRGGESIYSFEVEDALVQHPSVLEAAVLGAPDEQYGEVVRAVVVLKPGEFAEAFELQDFCLQRIARFKVPQAIEFVRELPRNSAGKVKKDRLKTNR